jgi:hypothetical protein
MPSERSTLYDFTIVSSMLDVSRHSLGELTLVIGCCEWLE